MAHPTTTPTSVHDVGPRELFDQHRGRKRRRRVIAVTIGASVLGAVIIVGAVSIMSTDGAQEIRVSPAAEPDDELSPDLNQVSPSDPAGFPEEAELDYEIVTIIEPGGPVDPSDRFRMSRLAEEVQVIADQAELDEMWRGLGLHQTTRDHEGSPPPQLDFTQSVVFVNVEGAPAMCADPLHLEGEGSTLWFRFERFEGGCHLRQGWALYVITVPRQQLPQQFTLERDYYGLNPPHDLLRQEVTLPAVSE